MQNAPSIASTILSRDTMPLIYGSTGDLYTGSRRSENGDVKVPYPKQPALAASPRGDGYKMTSLENLDIVLITSDDVDSGTAQRASASPDGASSASSVPLTSCSVTSPRHEPSSPGGSEARTTVAGLPSVHSLIAKFSPLGNDLHTTSAKFASSRQRWASTPRLEGPASCSPEVSLSSPSSLLLSLSSSQTSLSGKKLLSPAVQSSARYQWSPSTSSWMLSSSSSPERRRQPVSSIAPPQV